MAEPAARPPFFCIVGRGRSGTALLARMLNAHPRVCVPYEALFAVNLRRRYGRRTTWPAPVVRQFVADLWRDDRLRTWGLNESVLGERLADAAATAPTSYWTMCRTVYATYAASCDKPPDAVLGDKNPTYSLLVPDLLDLIPDVRFVWMIRDPRANVASYQQVPFDARDAGVLAERWRRYQRALREAKARVPDRFLDVRFEALVAEPEATLRRVCQHIGVAFDAQMLAFQTQGNRQGVAWHRNLDGEVRADRAAGWQSRLSAAEAATVAAIAGPEAARYGYDLQASRGPTSLVARLRGRVGGTLLTWAERWIFAVPLGLRTWVMAQYRRRAGTYQAAK